MNVCFLSTVHTIGQRQCSSRSWKHIHRGSRIVAGQQSCSLLSTTIRHRWALTTLTICLFYFGHRKTHQMFLHLFSQWLTQQACNHPSSVITKFSPCLKTQFGSSQPSLYDKYSTAGLVNNCIFRLLIILYAKIWTESECGGVILLEKTVRYRVWGEVHV